jgi:hypothetical protein
VAVSRLPFWKFLLAAIITLPKQALEVYLGSVFNNAEQSAKSQAISYSVLAATVVITILSGWYIYHHVGKWRRIILEERAEDEKGMIMDIEAFAEAPRRRHSSSDLKQEGLQKRSPTRSSKPCDDLDLLQDSVLR